MAIHSFHIFDRKGKTLYTKCYVKKPTTAKEERSKEEEEEKLSEQRKLVFGMLFSLRELSSSLSPTEGPGDLQMVKTGATTLYNYETVSGLRFVLYTTGDTSNNKRGSTSNNSSAATTPQSSVHGGTSPGNSAPTLTAPTTTGMINTAMAGADPNSSNNNISHHGGSNPAVTSDIRSSLKHIYENIWVTSVIRSPMYRPNSSDSSESIQSTNFEAEIDGYFKRKSWFR
jgi:hypothetical protein